MTENYIDWFDAVFPEASGAKLFDHSIEAYNARFTFLLERTFPWFKGHYPGNPVLPGVVQLHGAIQLGQKIFVDGACPHKVTQVKFKEMILPNASVMLILKFKPEQSLLKFYYQKPNETDGQFTVGTVKF